MSTQAIGGRTRSRLGAVLLAAVLAIAVTVLAVQASSIWAARSRSDAPARVAPSTIVSLPEVIHGRNRGQVQYGRLPEQQAPVRSHGPNQMPRSGS